MPMLRVFIKLPPEILDQAEHREEVRKVIAEDVARTVRMTLTSLVKKAKQNGVKPSEQVARDMGERSPPHEPDSEVVVQAYIDAERPHEKPEKSP